MRYAVKAVRALVGRSARGSWFQGVQDVSAVTI